MVFNHVIDYDKLSEIGFKIKNEFELDGILTDIKFRHPMCGNKTKAGCITKKRHDNIYRINITTTKAHWIEDENGTHIDNKTKKHLRRHPIGILSTDNEIVHTLAHELAHLKFWNHGINHKKLTEQIYERLIELNDKYLLKNKIECEV